MCSSSSQPTFTSVVEEREDEIDFIITNDFEDEQILFEGDNIM